MPAPSSGQRKAKAERITEITVTACHRSAGAWHRDRELSPGKGKPRLAAAAKPSICIY